ncbi:hypothetical protein [Pseudoduganella aquatica]|uniref:Uncharacterized protein n=1 Tax=Pseudoduganella aquatica TaxID=2660641 RepID=A0A7X4KQ53_9BURK|nr:hypothetical protein [Pseudoduganella aquatica]MYN10902.1 hypothetical protein [Pseudoduganella aquatica]
MLVIRNTQLEAFGPLLRQRFEHELAARLVASYPRECRQAGGADQILLLVRQGVQAAAAQGYTSKRQAGIYVALTFILGVDFASDPQLPWVADYLDEQAIADPTVRLEQLFSATLDYLAATAGSDGQRVVRAMLRMRAFDLAAAPRRTGEAWISDVAAIFQQFYPEKYRHQGDALMRRVIWSGRRRAKQYGLAAPAGVFVFLELMFMLGSGFDHDPLHPWAAAILNDERIAGEAERTERLYAAAMAHLAQSLSGQDHEQDHEPQQERAA